MSKIKAIKRIRNFIIRKLGGIVYEDLPLNLRMEYINTIQKYTQDYWIKIRLESRFETDEK